MHIRHLMRCAMFAAAAIIGGALATIAPAAAQWKAEEINPDKIRLMEVSIKRPVDGWRAARFNRGELIYVSPGVTYKVDWYDNQNAAPSGTRHYREIGQRTATSFTVKSSDDKETLTFNFQTMRISGTTAGGNLSGEIYDISGTIGTTAFCLNSAGSEKCACDLRYLRPLQGAVGLGEVAKKTKDIKEELNKEKADLSADPIKVVNDPFGSLFVTDHHHGALAWQNAGYAFGLCAKSLDLAWPPGDRSKQFKEFEDQIKQKNLVRLDDEDGKPIAWDKLPKTLTELASHNDPYRTLAWMVRKADAGGFNSKTTPKFQPGFCRAYITGATDFTEFAWADAMRENGKTNAALAVATVTAATAPALWDGQKSARLDKQVPVLQAALAFAKSDAAKTLPGWRGDKNDGGGACPADPS